MKIDCWVVDCWRSTRSTSVPGGVVRLSHEKSGSPTTVVFVFLVDGRVIAFLDGPKYQRFSARPEKPVPFGCWKLDIYGRNLLWVCKIFNVVCDMMGNVGEYWYVAYWDSECLNFGILGELFGEWWNLVVKSVF